MSVTPQVRKMTMREGEGIKLDRIRIQGGGVLQSVLADYFVFDDLGTPVRFLLAGGEGESYRIQVEDGVVTVVAPNQHGLARGASTLVQLAEMGEVPALTVEDTPRYPWRGLSLDVARSFFPVEEIKSVVDMLFRYRMNVLHLHLSDDQGWRLTVPKRPLLTEVSGQTSIAGGRAGFYTQEQFQEIVDYAAARSIQVVPEFDIPGHTFAATHAEPSLNADGEPTPAFTGMQVGLSALDASLPATRTFIDEVFAFAATTGSSDYVHLGGDEAFEVDREDYQEMVDWAAASIVASGKKVAAWQEAAGTGLPRESILQYWDYRLKRDALLEDASRGVHVLMSPANRTYLDMKPDASFAIGQDWAGHVDLRQAYEWDPAREVQGLDPDSIVGVEAALWTETVHSFPDLVTLLIPRLGAVAEVAWSRSDQLDWDDFRVRAVGEQERFGL